MQVFGDGDLDAARTGNPSMNEADPIKEWSQEVQLLIPVTVYQLLAAVIVTEISVEANVGMALYELYRSPNVLSNGSAVRFDEDRNPAALLRVQNGFHKRIYFAIVFDSQAQMDSDAPVSPVGMSCRDDIRITGNIDSRESTKR
jgi:hypothetical protein